MAKKYDFVEDFNELDIRKCTRGGSCKICNAEIKGKDIVYMKSFRLNSQPFHICLDCWEKINSVVEKYKREKFMEEHGLGEEDMRGQVIGIDGSGMPIYS